jgi:hypothetical protein
MPGPAELAEVGQRLDSLEQECARLTEALATQRTVIERLGAGLALLSQGRFPPGTRPIVLMVLAALLVAGGGAALLWTRAESAATVWLPSPTPLEPVLPHLLITADMERAEVVLDGAPRGKAPLLLALPAGSLHRLVVALPGRPRAFERSVRMGTRAGEHVHAALSAPVPADRRGGDR